MSDLKITSWNVHGIFNRIEGFRYNKTKSPHFWEIIGNSKIFGLIETHHLATEIDQIQINGYKCFNVCRKKITRRTTTSERKQVCSSNSKFQKESVKMQVTYGK